MQQLSTIQEPNGVNPVGYNDKISPNNLPEGFCVLALNCFLEEYGINERTGYALAGNDTGEAKPNLLLHSHETATYNHLLKINDDATGTAANLFYWTGTGNWVKVASPTFTAGLPCTAATAWGKTYITNGVDVVKAWDGTTLSNVAAIPITNFLFWYHDLLWAVRSSTYKNRAFYSQLNQPEVFNILTDFLDIAPEDSDYITGVNALKDELTFAKRFKIYTFQGWTEVDIVSQGINERISSHGSVSHDSMVNIGNDLLFISYDGYIPHVQAMSRTDLGDTVYGGMITSAIEGTMKGLSKGQFSKMAGLFDGRRVWFFVPNGSSTYNDLAINYDTITKGWTKHTGIYGARGCISSVTGSPLVYFADSRNSKVYYFNNGNSDNGAAIDFQYITRRFVPDFKRFFKWKYLYLQFLLCNAGTLNVYTKVDEYDYDLLEAIDLTQGPTGFPYTFPFVLGNTRQKDRRLNLPYQVYHNVTMKLTKNDTNNRTSIIHYAFMGFPRPLRYE